LHELFSTAARLMRGDAGGISVSLSSRRRSKPLAHVSVERLAYRRR
jgi:hypothetical protein